MRVRRLRTCNEPAACPDNRDSDRDSRAAWDMGMGTKMTTSVSAPVHRDIAGLVAATAIPTIGGAGILKGLNSMWPGSVSGRAALAFGASLGIAGAATYLLSSNDSTSVNWGAMAGMGAGAAALLLTSGGSVEERVMNVGVAIAASMFGAAAGAGVLALQND